MARFCAILGFIFLLAANVQSQDRMKIAVMDFNPGVGVSEEIVNGLSEMLITSLFETKKFTIIERNQLNRAIEEHGFQKSNISAGEVVQIGKIYGVKYILVGTVNFIVTKRTLEDVVTEMATGEYNIDVRIISVETGEVVSASGVTQKRTQTTRDVMPQLAKDLVSKIVAENGNIVKLFGYLYIFPEDLGCIAYSDAMEVIRNINSVALYGYGDWRLPTTNELLLMKNNVDKITGMEGGTYLSGDIEEDKYGNTYNIFIDYNNSIQSSKTSTGYYNYTRASVRLVRTDK